ncbi:MAG: helix-turn-helix domain-containing protein [Oscillospiraceae bacterium]|jgi:excisionase family DNA binding protein|nr:helix-turn-helix domain-containing protein [Oscillospiraceae bacterium]
MFNCYPDVVTVADLAKMLKVGRNTAYELVRANSIQSVKIGKSIRIPKESVIQYLARNSAKDD